MSYQSPDILSANAKKILNDYIHNIDELKAKDRLKIPAQEMPAQDPIIRAHNLEEVAIGYTMEEARVEALRCLECVKQTCIDGCPVKIDIPGFIRHIAYGEFQNAADVIKEASLLPSICGRVCPQETQCQETCKVGTAMKDVDKAVAIGRLERFVADWEREQGNIKIPSCKT